MPKKRHVSEDSDEAESPVVKKTKVKKTASSSTSTKSSKDAEGNPYWEVSSPMLCGICILNSLTFSLPQIGNKRRIGTSKFKGTSLVNIREYYEAAGELKPGKKVVPPSIPLLFFAVKLASVNDLLTLPT